VPYETKPIGSRTGETQTAEYTLLNPRQKIPLLQDGNFSIAESPAIIIYLAEAYSGGNVQLLLDRQRARAQLLEWSTSSQWSWTQLLFTSSDGIEV
jgi:glutathione S-transferase